MASNENEPGSRPPAPSAEDIIRAVHDDFAAVGDRVFRGLGASSLDEHLAELRFVAQGLFGPPHG